MNDQRRLAAILSADMVGYSRLMEADESGTIARQKSFRKELIDPKLAAHGGRIVKTTGDGILVEFPSVIEAVKFAANVQRAMVVREEKTPENKRILYRIGINLGDIVIDGDDILGDGVNIAARLESLALPGGICISRNVFNQIKNRLSFGYEELGPTKVKNISEPVVAFRVLLDPADAGKTIRAKRIATLPNRFVAGISASLFVLLVGGVAWWQPWESNTDSLPSMKREAFQSDKPSIAVLPFTNMSSDPEQEYFSDGLTEDLLTDLSKISALSVVSRSASFAYKGKVVDIRAVAKDLGISHVVEGSVRKAGGRVRITTQLVDAVSGTQLWADRYDRNLEDIFALQDEVRGEIVSALQVTLTPSEKRRLARRRTENAEAYDLYLQGLRQESFFTKDANSESRRLFEEAIVLDPKFTLAYARLSLAYSLAQENDWVSDKEVAAQKALRLAEKAVALDSDSPFAHWALARVLTRPLFNDPERALSELRQTVNLDPNFADGHAFLANVLNYVGRAEEALGIIKTAIRINPHHPFWYIHIKGQCLLLLGRYEEAIPAFQAAIERNPTFAPPHRFLLATYGHLGRTEDAEWEISELEALNQRPTIKWVKNNTPFIYPEYINRYLEGLRKAGVPEE